MMCWRQIIMNYFKHIKILMGKIHKTLKLFQLKIVGLILATKTLFRLLPIQSINLNIAMMVIGEILIFGVRLPIM